MLILFVEFSFRSNVNFYLLVSIISCCVFFLHFSFVVFRACLMAEGKLLYISFLRCLFQIGYLLREQKFFAFANVHTQTHTVREKDRAFWLPGHFILLWFCRISFGWHQLSRTKPASFISHSKQHDLNLL